MKCDFYYLILVVLLIAVTMILVLSMGRCIFLIKTQSNNINSTQSLQKTYDYLSIKLDTVESKTQDIKQIVQRLKPRPCIPETVYCWIWNIDTCYVFDTIYVFQHHTDTLKVYPKDPRFQRIERR